MRQARLELTGRVEPQEIAPANYKDGLAARWEGRGANGGAHDRWATSVINTRVQSLYYGVELVGGVVLSPRARLLCSYPLDGNSLGKVCSADAAAAACVPGCVVGGGGWCPRYDGPRSRTWSCAYQPNRLAEALRAQQDLAQVGQERNNELVVDLADHRRRLPGSVEGFFYFSTSDATNIDAARETRRAFVAHFGLNPARAPPLLELDLDGGGQRPWRLGTAE